RAVGWTSPALPFGRAVDAIRRQHERGSAPQMNFLTLRGSQDFNPEVPVLTIPIRALLLLAMALAAVSASSPREGDQCYSSCKARCVARYACEGRHPGPNCFTNFNKCRTSCWRMCRH